MYLVVRIGNMQLKILNGHNQQTFNWMSGNYAFSEKGLYKHMQSW